MPPLDEGTLLYMPTTLPGISVTEAARLLQVQDKIIKSFPEVERVFGKAGRAESATDPAPYSMMETVIVLKPQDRVAEARTLVLELGAPTGCRAILAPLLAGPQTTQELIYGPGGLNEALHHARHRERLDHADQGPYRHAHHRHTHARSASRCSAPT